MKMSALARPMRKRDPDVSATGPSPRGSDCGKPPAKSA
jgi:hypothetical protein